MEAFVVYESLYGNTRKIAEAIVEGLQTSVDARTVLVGDARPSLFDEAALVVVGGPTHGWSLSHRRTRQAAADDAAKHDARIDRAAVAIGVREWLKDIDGKGRRSAAFDTRLDRPRFLTGSAVRAIERGLRAAHFTTFGPPRSFRVSGTTGPLVEGELERARQWGQELGRALSQAAGLQKAA